MPWVAFRAWGRAQRFHERLEDVRSLPDEFGNQQYWVSDLPNKNFAVGQWYIDGASDLFEPGVQLSGQLGMPDVQYLGSFPNAAQQFLQPFVAYGSDPTEAPRRLLRVPCKPCAFAHDW